MLAEGSGGKRREGAGGRPLGEKMDYSPPETSKSIHRRRTAGWRGGHLAWGGTLKGLQVNSGRGKANQKVGTANNSDSHVRSATQKKRQA